MDDFILDFTNKLIINNNNSNSKLIKLKLKTNNTITEPVIEPKVEQKLKGGAKCLDNGIKYEKKIWDNLKYITINNKKFNTQTELELGGSTLKTDILCNFNNNIKNIGIEIKNIISTEYIQLDVHKNKGDKWQGPSKSRNPLSIVNRYLEEINSQSDLYYGILPPLNKTREEFDKWQEWLVKEKIKRCHGKTKEYTWICKDKDFVRKNYRDKGCHYIQINNYGLYHLGEDICNFNVPEFNPDIIILRLRCKRRGGKGCIPSSITMSPTISGLIKSNFTLDNIEKMPKNLIYKKE
jgi:hypothetical protein